MRSRSPYHGDSTAGLRGVGCLVVACALALAGNAHAQPRPNESVSEYFERSRREEAEKKAQDRAWKRLQDAIDSLDRRPPGSDAQRTRRDAGPGWVSPLAGTLLGRCSDVVEANPELRKLRAPVCNDGGSPEAGRSCAEQEIRSYWAIGEAFERGKVTKQDYACAAIYQGLVARHDRDWSRRYAELLESGKVRFEGDLKDGARDMVTHYFRAADLGDRDAAARLARLLWDGSNPAVAISRHAAFGLIRQAGDRYPDAPRLLALEDGKADLTWAVAVYEDGVARGDSWSEYRLGRVYETGAGKPADLARAAALYRLAAAKSYGPAVERLKEPAFARLADAADPAAGTRDALGQARRLLEGPDIRIDGSTIGDRRFSCEGITCEYAYRETGTKSLRQVTRIFEIATFGRASPGNSAPACDLSIGDPGAFGIVTTKEPVDPSNPAAGERTTGYDGGQTTSFQAWVSSPQDCRALDGALRRAAELSKARPARP